jgi:rRNA maturation endonuclease Nob1
MSKDEALKMAIEVMYRNSPKIRLTQELEEAINACKEALEQPAQEHNFCSRCGKRASKDLNQIHTCTPPNN